MKATSVYPDNLQRIAVAVDIFFEQAIENDTGSLFTPGVAIWSTSNLLELKMRFVDQFDDSAATFEIKLAKQLQGATDPALQLMAEMLYVYYMIADQMLAKTKLAKVEEVLRWMRHPVTLPPALVAAFDQGLTTTGTYYLTNKPFQLWFLINAGLAWRQLNRSDRETLLADPWAFKKFLMTVPENKGAPMRMALLHLVFPETFEIIISATHKRQICAGFPEIASDEKDEDRKLAAIKRTLPPEPKTIWIFYRKEVTKIWEPEKKESTPLKEASQSQPTLPPTNVLSSSASIAAVAQSLSIDSEWLTEVREVLLDRGQIVLHGPPGTGKTLIARTLAGSLAAPECVHFVQFHPAYSYEDFIEGLRPKAGGGSVTFEVKHGPLRRIAAAAAAAPEKPHVLVIDEFNRANLARVLGELVFLLEYRGEPATLAYSGDRFSIPKNLYIIGTMNTADRSIALIDAAIRRRFAFFRLAPDCDPIDRVLAEWLDSNAPDMGWVDELVSAANKLIQSPDHAIGPAFFMRQGLNDAALERVWKRQVLPYLDEFLHDSPEIRMKLDFAALRNLVTGNSERAL